MHVLKEKIKMQMNQNSGADKKLVRPFGNWLIVGDTGLNKKFTFKN